MVITSKSFTQQQYTEEKGDHVRHQEQAEDEMVELLGITSHSNPRRDFDSRDNDDSCHSFHNRAENRHKFRHLDSYEMDEVIMPKAPRKDDRQNISCGNDDQKHFKTYNRSGNRIFNRSSKVKQSTEYNKNELKFNLHELDNVVENQDSPLGNFVKESRDLDEFTCNPNLISKESEANFKTK